MDNNIFDNLPFTPYNDVNSYMRYYNDFSRINLQDIGPNPFVGNIDEITKNNNTFRTVIWTGKHLQVTVMSIKPGEDIGIELHKDSDQFVRIEEGSGLLKIGNNKDNLNFQKKVYDDFAFIIPAGKWHNLINTGTKPLKIYSIYAPPEHKQGSVKLNKEDY